MFQREDRMGDGKRERVGDRRRRKKMEGGLMERGMYTLRETAGEKDQRERADLYFFLSCVPDSEDHSSVTMESVNKIGSAALLPLRRIQEASE